MLKKKHLLHTGKKIEMMRSAENLGRTSEWDVMRRPCFITTVFIILHRPVSQHAMRSSTNEVSYRGEKRELGNRWVQHWDWDEGTRTGLCSQAQAMNVHWFRYHTRIWWKSWGNQRGQLSEINSVKVNMVNAFMILCYSLKQKPGNSEMKTIIITS